VREKICVTLIKCDVCKISLYVRKIYISIAALYHSIVSKNVKFQYNEIAYRIFSFQIIIIFLLYFPCFFWWVSTLPIYTSSTSPYQVWYIVSIPRAHPGGKVYLASSYNVSIILSADRSSSPCRDICRPTLETDRRALSLLFTAHFINSCLAAIETIARHVAV